MSPPLGFWFLLSQLIIAPFVHLIPVIARVALAVLATCALFPSSPNNRLLNRDSTLGRFVYLYHSCSLIVHSFFTNKLCQSSCRCIWIDFIKIRDRNNTELNLNILFFDLMPSYTNKIQLISRSGSSFELLNLLFDSFLYIVKGSLFFTICDCDRLLSAFDKVNL